MFITQWQISKAASTGSCPFPFQSQAQSFIPTPKILSISARSTTSLLHSLLRGAAGAFWNEGDPPMESILARALEYTLKYWLKSFSRDQFKLQGRTAQLSNLGEFSLTRLLISSISLVTNYSVHWVFLFYFIFLFSTFEFCQISMETLCIPVWGYRRR